MDDSPALDLTRVEVVGRSPGGDDFPNNVWLVGDETECLVVDASHDAAEILAAVGPRRVTGIVLTHGHWDHVNAVEEMRGATGAPVYLHPADQVLAERTVTGFVADAPLTDGLSLAVGGWSVEVRHTPGHTPGSCSIVVPGAGAVLTGDTLFPGGPGATRWEYSDFAGIIASIRTRLLTLPAATVVGPGHGETTSIAAEAGSIDAWEARGW